MALGETTNLGFRLNEPRIGTGASAIGGYMFVLNDSITAADAKPLDPYYDNGTNVRPAIVPDMGLQLEMYVVWDGSATSLGVAPEVTVFGLTPTPNKDRRLWPYDIDTGFKDVSADTVSPGLWVPLTNTDAPFSSASAPTDTLETSDHIQFPDTAAIAHDDGGDADKWRMTRRISVYLGGCTQVMVLCKTGTGTTNIDKAMVIGRFVG